MNKPKINAIAMSIVKKIAKNTGIIIGGDVINKIISLVIIVVLARYLGSAGYGKYAFVLAYLSFFGVIADFGVNSILVRDISRNKSIASKYIGNSAVMKLIFSILAIILSVIIITLTSYPMDTKTYVYIASITLLFSSLSGLYAVLFQVYLKMKYSTVANLIDRFLFAILILELALLNGSLFYVFIAFVFSKFVGMVVSYIYFRKFVTPKYEIDLRIWKYLLKESWPLTLTTVFVMIYMRIDQIMLSIMCGDSAVGYYSVAVSLVESLGIIPGAFMMSVFPFLSEYFQNSKEVYKRIYKLCFKYMSMLIIPIAVGTTLLAEPIIKLIYGYKYLPSVSALQVLIWSEVFVFIGVVYNQILISANKQNIIIILTGTSAIINIILNILLIPIYGIVGAGIATVISYAFGFLIGIFLSTTRDYSISAFKSMIKPTFVSIIIGIYIYYIKFLFNKNFLYLFITILTAPVIYLFILYLINGITHEDIKIFKKIVLSKVY
ncbi:flippase [Archaeoglobus sp.]